MCGVIGKNRIVWASATSGIPDSGMASVYTKLTKYKALLFQNIPFYPWLTRQYVFVFHAIKLFLMFPPILVVLFLEGA